MMYFFLWTKVVACSASFASARETQTRTSPPNALLERINLTAIARHVDHAFRDYRRALNRTSEPGAPKHFSCRSIERHRSPRLHIHHAFTEHQGRGNHAAGPRLPLQLSCLGPERIYVSVFAADIHHVAGCRGRRRNPQTGFILPAHRAAPSIQRINIKIFRTDEKRVALERRRRIDSV